MSDPVEFLTARLAQTEQRALKLLEVAVPVLRAQVEAGYWETMPDVADEVEAAAVEALRAVEAKRRIVSEYEGLNARAKYPDHEGGMADGLDLALSLLAEANADHPDYDESWRP